MTKQTPDEIITQIIQTIAPDEDRFIFVTVPDSEMINHVANALNQYMQANNARFSGVVVKEGVSVQLLDDLTMCGLGWIRASGPATDTIQ